MEPQFAQAYARWKAWDPSEFGRYRAFEGTYFTRELSGLHLGPKARVLEIGFGNGGFLAYSRDRGFDAHGIERNDDLVRIAQQHGFTASGSEALDDLANQGAYDLIAAFDVIEHIDTDELPGFLRKLRALLVPGGHLIARFPNGGSPFARLTQHGDITHKRPLARPAISQLAGLAGLDVIAVRNQKVRLHGNPAIATARLIQRVMRWAIEGVIGLVYYERREPLEMNLVAVLRRTS